MLEKRLTLVVEAPKPKPRPPFPTGVVVVVEGWTELTPGASLPEIMVAFKWDGWWFATKYGWRRIVFKIPGHMVTPGEHILGICNPRDNAYLHIDLLQVYVFGRKVVERRGVKLGPNKTWPIPTSCIGVRILIPCLR